MILFNIFNANISYHFIDYHINPGVNNSMWTNDNICILVIIILMIEYILWFLGVKQDIDYFTSYRLFLLDSATLNPGV